MKNLIIGALHERGVNGDDRDETFGRQTGGERDAVLFRYAHVIASLRELFGEGIEAGSLGHGRRDPDHAGNFRASLTMVCPKTWV